MKRLNGRMTYWILGLAVVCAGIALAAPASADVKSGERALEAGRLDEAAREFEKAASSGRIEGRIGMGRVLLRQRKYDEAVQVFKSVQGQDPQNAWGYFGEGEAYRLSEQCTRAIPLYRKATDLDRKFPLAQLSLGRCLIETKDYAGALEALSVGLKWGSDWRPRFLVGLGDAELARDSLRDAGIYYTRAREEAPNAAAPHAALGNFYVARGIPALAVPEYQAAVDLDTSSVENRFGLAQALYFDKRYGQALQEYEWVVQRDPEFAPGRLAIGNLYYLSGPADPSRYKDAKPHLEAYVKMKPRDAKGWSLLGRTLFFVGEKDRAYEALTRSIELGEKTKETFTVLARVHTERKEWDKALAAFQKGDPDERDYLMIGQIYEIAGRAASAESLYLAIVDADSTRRLAWFALNQLGKMKFRAKDYPAAIAAFKRRIALDPENGEAYYFMGLAHKEMNQYADALAALRNSARLETDKADRHFWLGILYAQQDSIPQARTALSRSVELDSTSTTASVAYRQLGFYHLLDRDWGRAIRSLERSVELNEGDVQAWVWLGQGYQNAGNRSKALDGYERALQIDPGQPDALKGKRSLQGGGR